MPAIPVGMFVNTYPARCPNLPATSNSHFLDWYLNQDYIAAVPVPQHVDLAQWSSTKPSEYYGELHSDGGPLTYAPTLGVPLLYTDPRYAHLASSRPPQLEIAYEMPKYQAWSPVKVLYAYDQLSNAPYTAATANVEAELLQVPLPEELLLEHQLRVLTLVRWWEVKNEQRRRQRQRLTFFLSDPPTAPQPQRTLSRTPDPKFPFLTLTPLCLSNSHLFSLPLANSPRPSTDHNQLLHPPLRPSSPSPTNNTINPSTLSLNNNKPPSPSPSPSPNRNQYPSPPAYNTWHPISVLHTFNLTQSIPAMSSDHFMVQELLQTPLPPLLRLENDLRIAALEWWWEERKVWMGDGIGLGDYGGV
ncbi:MAG: hypothetical protein L6R41_002023 [Letrouitia leprolyta]|nr:MAG: hypothetical protein L6R41_002023 [Letrouitia leprolyta]